MRAAGSLVKKPAFSIERIGILYLYVPIILFLLTWINLWIAVPVILLIAYALISSGLTSANNACMQPSKRFWFFLAITFALIVLWCCLSGLGGYAKQPDDWMKHNLILKDLIEKPWPVYYRLEGSEGALCYYIAEYLVPALAGKALGFDFACDVLLVWCALGLLLAVVLIYKEYGKVDGTWKPWVLPVIVVCIGLFATLLTPVAGLYRIWCPKDLGDGAQWISKSIRIQYSSNITLLRWVFPQFVPTVVVMALVVRFRRRYGVWALLAAPLVLYSTFAFLGCALFMVLLFSFDNVRNTEWKTNVRQAISVENLAGFAAMFVLLMYVAGTVLQPKPESAKMGLELINYSGHIPALIAFHVAWILWVLILWKNESRNRALWVVCVLLLVFPLFKMGMWNDLCMRASIPALLCLCFMVIKNLLSAVASKESRGKFYAFVLIACLLAAGLGNARELYDGFKKANHQTRNYTLGLYVDALDFYQDADFTLYQYVDWNQDDISHTILQK